MIALDTNIVLRYVLQDDRVQSALATSLIEQRLTPTKQGFISLIVICEIVWALRRTYQLPRDRICAFLTMLVDASHLSVEAGQAVAAAAERPGDIADAVIHLIGKQNGCTHTLTFDRKFSRVEGVELLA